MYEDKEIGAEGAAGAVASRRNFFLLTYHPDDLL